MVDGVEANPKLPDFKRVLSLATLLQVLYPLPVASLEPSVVVHEQRGALKLHQLSVPETSGIHAMLTAVDEKANRSRPSIVRVLNYLLQRKCEGSTRTCMMLAGHSN